MAPKIWLKRVLVPLWVIQVIVLVVLVAAEGMALWVVDDAQNEGVFDGENLHGAVNGYDAVVAVFLAFTCLTIIVDTAEIILAARQKLKPVANIVIQSMKSAIWTFSFVVIIFGTIIGNSGGLGVMLFLMMFLTCIAQLIYGSVIVHRYRKGTLYKSDAAHPGAA